MVAELAGDGDNDDCSGSGVKAEMVCPNCLFCEQSVRKERPLTVKYFVAAVWPKLDSVMEGTHSRVMSPRWATNGLVSKHLVYASYSEDYVQRVLMQYHKGNPVIHANFSFA